MRFDIGDVSCISLKVTKLYFIYGNNLEIVLNRKAQGLTK